MNSDFDQHVTTIIVDGEDLYVPDPTGWETVRKEHLFRGWPIGVEGLLLQWVEFCSGHPELRVALGKVGKAFDAWIAYVIVSINSRPTRIQLQTVQCPNCKWKGAGGTTAEPDLFVAAGSRVPCQICCGPSGCCLFVSSVPATDARPHRLVRRIRTEIDNCHEQRLWRPQSCPLLRQQLLQLRHRHVGNAGQHAAEVGLGIEAMPLKRWR